jgi:UDP-N-acetylglucosamine--N-acetylmuramyl-(pentapeptide) pyrophosphoryl-undecaprenol N-acetylglucosamine transferase
VRVLLAGGGSGGSATPVLAVAQVLRRRDPSIELLYVGTRDGPEAALAAGLGIAFVGVHAGKLRRYWDAQNLSDPLRVMQGIAESYAVARKFRPNAALAAGGFGAVPPIVAARAFGARTLIHQQDVVPGLANRLLVPFARAITVSMGSSLGHFPRAKTMVTGNPVRQDILTARPELAFERLNLEPSMPLIVATGGGTGALALNRLVAAAAPRLVERAQIVHLTGRGRGVPPHTDSPRYRVIEFLVDEMPHLLAAATVVVSRAGMGTLTELAALGKAALVVPMPDSHQDANARAFASLGAVQVADQSTLTPERLTDMLNRLLDNMEQRERLARNLKGSMPQDAAERITSILLGRCAT